MTKEIEIIFEDENLLAIDKPSGLVVHSDGRTKEASLVDWLRGNFPSLENIGNPHTLDSERYEKRWGIVNRLDRDTSGMILIAKDVVTFFDLQKQFSERKVVKEYLAKVWGKIDIEKLLQESKVKKIDENQFEISEPVSRHKKDPRIWVCGKNVGERISKREAVTDFKIIDSKENFSLIKLLPKTGRTHQLRLHCRFIGNPIVGDKKYGIKGIANEHGISQIENLKIMEEVLREEKDSRLMLHAKSLEFFHPKKKLLVKINCENPTFFSF